MNTQTMVKPAEADFVQCLRYFVGSLLAEVQDEKKIQY